MLNFEDDLVSLLEHQYDTAFSRHPYPACWFLFLPSHEDHNISSTYQHSLFFCCHDLLYLEVNTVPLPWEANMYYALPKGNLDFCPALLIDIRS